MRDYGIKGQMGLESHPQEYIMRIVAVMREIHRVLKKAGSVYLNLGDTYCGSWGSESKNLSLRKQPVKSPQARMNRGKWLQPKQMLLIPSRIAIALQEEGWILRNDIIYKKLNPMPNSMKDRLTTTYEHVFHFVESRKYFYDLDAIREPWRDKNPNDLKRAIDKHLGYSGKYASGNDSRYRRNLPGQGMRGQPVGDPSKGKNPGDVIRIGAHHGHSLTKGRAVYYEGQVIISHPRGKNPGDVIRDYHSRALPYLENNPHRERQFGKKEARHALGRNPGDVINGRPVRPPHHHFRGEGWEENAFERGVAKNHVLGKNPGDFWEIKTQPFRGAHFAVYPEKLCEKPIRASCPAEVCKRCGKPRVKILEQHVSFGRKPSRTKYDTKTSTAGRLAQKRQAYRELGYESPPAPGIVGYSDCGCKEYYCCNCEKYLTPETLNNKYAIQKQREKEGICSELGKEQIQENERIGNTDSGNKFLQREKLFDLWKEILWKKDATMLFKEMRGSITNPERNTQFIPKGDTFSKLQGGFNKQQWIQNNNDKWQEDTRTSLDNGTIFKQEIREMGRNPSQEWNKNRQQNREFRNSNQEQTQWIDCVSLLQGIFQYEIKCPFCFSDRITIKSVGRTSGIVLDPFCGSGTTCVVAKKLGRNWIGIDINPDYCRMARRRVAQVKGGCENLWKRI